MERFMIILGVMAICFMGVTSNASTERLLFNVGFFQSDVSADLAKYRSFLNELEKSDIMVETETLHVVKELAVFYKKNGQEIGADLLVKGVRGCTQFDESCVRIIDLGNPGVNWRNKDYAGEVVLPTLVLRHDLTVATRGNTKRLQDVMKQFDQNILLPVGNPTPP